MQIPLLTTKLFIPPARPGLVPRPRLIEQLNSGLSLKLALVSAPAGFGKSTLLSSWVQQIETGTGVAWLSLDESDNDLTRFLIYFIAALQTIEASIGQGILAALQPPGVMNTETVLTLLLNEIAQLPHEVVLILDDYHVIESQSVDRAITYMLEHLPLQMHLMVGTRSDPPWPLARLRAQGQMLEIRTQHLRFTIDEASVFLNLVMGFDLSHQDVAALDARTEGWITGLQMAALSMQGSNDLPGFVHSFTGSNRYILDYLGEEVLSQQPQHIQDFLLQTSILNRLTGVLCDAVTESSDGEKFLENLERRNLFIIPLDNERRWHRYHHLFADMLNRRLNQQFPDVEPELHRRASLWYQEAGDIDEAIHHALAAGNTEQTANILEDHWQEFFVRGELIKLKSMLDSLGPEIVDNNVILRMAYCMIYSQTGAIELIPSHTAFIRKRINDFTEKDFKQSSNMAAIPSLFETMEAIVALGSGQAAKAKTHAKKAISLIPDDASPVDRRRLILGANFRLGQAHIELGELDQACSILLEELEMLKATDSYYVVGTAIQILSIYQKSGRTQEALTLCEDTLHFVAKKHWDELPPVGLIYVTLAGLQADTGEYEAARENLGTGMRLVKQQVTPEIIKMVEIVEGKLGNITPPSQPLIDPLSERELEVLRLIAQGLSNREISDQLFLALSTVKGHNRNIFNKLQVQRRTEAVARARELGLV